MKSFISKIDVKGKIFIGIAGVLVASLSVGGYALAAVMARTTNSQVKTVTVTLTYSDILNSPSDGNGGYLVKLANLPAHARITSTDMYVKTVFTTNEPVGQQAQPFGTINLVVPNTGTAVNDIAQGDLQNGGVGYVPQPPASVASDPILPTQGELLMDVVNTSTNGSLSNLNAGQLITTFNYIQYPTP